MHTRADADEQFHRHAALRQSRLSTLLHERDSALDIEVKKFSIVMATLNSMRTLEASLKSIRAQDYPQDLVEIMVVDGGSTEGPLEPAARYGCRVLENPRVEPVSAKLIGMREATGDYLMHVDSDEVIVSPRALRKRARAFEDYPEVKMVF